MVPRAEPEHALPHPAARGLCARRRVSEANRGNAPALRPEMAALPRYRQQMCNIFTSFRASRTPLLTNNLFAYHKFCMRNTARPRRGPTGNGRAHHTFHRLMQSQSPRNDANIVPYKSFAAFVTIGKISPRRNEGIPPCSHFYCSAHTSQPAPSPKIPNFSFLISNFSSRSLPHRRPYQLLPLTS